MENWPGHPCSPGPVLDLNLPGPLHMFVNGRDYIFSPGNEALDYEQEDSEPFG